MNSGKRFHIIRLIGLALSFVCSLQVWGQDFIWKEGEDAVRTSVKRHPWWYDKLKAEEFSGGDWISHWSDEGDGEVEYTFNVSTPGTYTFWVRGNSIQSTLAYQLNSGPKTEIDLTSAKDVINVAADGKPDLRFISWIEVGDVDLKKGDQTISFFFTSENNHHGILDAFVFVKGAFTPRGSMKPGMKVETEDGWAAWEAEEDPFEPSVLDLRYLNEGVAGEHGVIEARNGEFVRSGDGQSVRFWGVNGPPQDLNEEALRTLMRALAKRGVNLIRIHGAVFDKETGTLNRERVTYIQEVVARAKEEGIYTHLSIYFPLWFEPRAGLDFLQGYNGSSKPFASLYFNRAFESHYQGWWRELLTTPSAFGPALVNDPAVFGLELVNEDSFFFWTFDRKNIPEPQMRMLEEAFYLWIQQKYGTVDKAYAAWESRAHARDSLNQKRLGFRSLWEVVNQRTARDQDTVEFLARTQRSFYQRQVNYLKQELGFKGLITASNWHTASARYLKPLELWSYLEGDFIDRHGYFGTFSQGEQVAWSIREGDVFADRSALRFESRKPGGKTDFSHPVADVEVNGYPSMISETAWTRPNRYRTEAPLFYAVYGSLQGSDSVVHFALDGQDWSVKPRFFMQPWTLMSPTQMGQFPATALMYRRGDIAEGKVVASVGLSEADLFTMKGTPLVQEGNLDELRLADVSGVNRISEGVTIDPRIHFVGKTRMQVGGDSVPGRVENITPYLQTESKRIHASNGQVVLDYGKGFLWVKAPKVEAVSGNLLAAGEVNLSVLRLRSGMKLAQVILISLDDQPLSRSSRMLLQVMSEEKTSGWKARDVNGGKYRVESIGRDPWLVKEMNGTIGLNRPDADEFTVTGLDVNGYPLRSVGKGKPFALLPGCAYYVIQK